MKARWDRIEGMGANRALEYQLDSALMKLIATRNVLSDMLRVYQPGITDEEIDAAIDQEIDAVNKRIIVGVKNEFFQEPSG